MLRFLMFCDIGGLGYSLYIFYFGDTSHKPVSSAHVWTCWCGIGCVAK